MIQIYFGNGKGKTTAAIGQAVRFASYGFPVLMIKFLKRPNTSGEDRLLKKWKLIRIVHSSFPCPLSIGHLSRETRKKVFQSQRDLFFSLPRFLERPYRMIVLDEILDLVKPGIIRTEELVSGLRNAASQTEIILTGHYLNPRIKAQADLVTKMEKIKHYFNKGVKARKGIEF
ncbi:MAG: cob(I)yrinic acid a,c-diamide adenosyltransferase [bacterium]|nr:cob(I)yrinic acid a,c-diamide adenosyltransferase [bacterium]